MTRDQLIEMVDVYAESRLEAADPECSTRYAEAKVARDAVIDAVDALFARIRACETAHVRTEKR